MSDLTVALTIATALGCGVAGGIFFAFSTFVMRALEDVPVPAGVGAMQAINLRVINPWFMLVFLGTGVAGAATIAIAVANLGDAYAPYLIAAGILYIVGSIVVTMAGNQPRNLALGELGLEPRDAHLRKVRVEGEIRPTGDVDRALTQSLVHRHQG